MIIKSLFNLNGCNAVDDLEDLYNTYFKQALGETCEEDSDCAQLIAEDKKGLCGNKPGLTGKICGLEENGKCSAPGADKECLGDLVCGEDSTCEVYVCDGSDGVTCTGGGSGR